MSFEKSALSKNWWFILPLALCAILTKQWLFTAAGVDAHRESFFSALNMIHLLVYIALYVIYVEVAAFLFRVIGPTVTLRASSTERQ